jgi:hypothetical protein
MRKQLGEVATLRAGYQFRERFDPDSRGNVAVVQIKDFDEDRRFRPQSLDRARLDKSTDPYRVDQGDVLFLSRGHRLFAAPIEHPLEDTIATNYFFVLTPKSQRVHYRYLAWYLNQPAFQAELRPFVRGSHMPLVSTSDLEAMWIDIPPLAVQDAIVALDELDRREQRLVGEIRRKRADLIQAVSMRAARRDR